MRATPVVFAGALTLLPFLPRSALSATVRVPADQPTIQSGIDAAAPGDTVLVACGTYYEHDVTLIPGIVLRSETGLPDCVVLDAQRNGRGLFGVGLTAGTVVEGITITGGINDEGHDFGREERTPGDWVGVPAPGERDWGGGGGAYFILSQVTFRSCSFAGNHAAVHGGGLRLEGGSPVLEACAFDENQAGNQGGGLYVGLGTSVGITGCSFQGNSARHGGGVHVASATAVTSTNCSFHLNWGFLSGGAFSSAFSDPVFVDCTFSANKTGLRNYTPRRGGAIAATGNTMSLTGCTLVWNVGSTGAAIQVNSTNVTVDRSLIAYSSTAPFACTGGSVLLSCSDVFGNSSGDYVDCIAGQSGVSGNFSADPLLCMPHSEVPIPEPGSPCLPANNSCGVLVGAHSAPSCPSSVPLTVDTVPAALQVEINWSVETAPATIDLFPGETVALGSVSPQYTSDTGYVFQDWSDGSLYDHYVVVPDSGASYTARYRTGSYLLTVTSDPGGSVTPQSGFFDVGSTPYVRATPDASHEFVSWVGSGPGSYTGTLNPAPVTMDGPITQHAVFQTAYHTLTMAADSGGTVTPATGSYVQGTQVVITATPAFGFDFDGWSGTGSGSYSGANNPALVTMLGPVTETAHFAAVPVYTLTMAADSGGTVTPQTGDYEVGTVVPISATPDLGFEFTGWTGTGPGSYTGPYNPAVVVVDGPLTETAHFTPVPVYTLTMAADSGGTVTPQTGDYEEGTVVPIAATADLGFEFTGWTGTGPGSYTGTATPASVTVNGPLTETAHFAAVPVYTLTTVAGPGGIVTPPTGDHSAGAQVSIHAQPDSGYAFGGWTGVGPGSYSGLANPTTITMDGDITETAAFVETDSLLLSMIADPGGWVWPSSGYQAPGARVGIAAYAYPGWVFTGWTGQGNGSYTGTNQAVSVTMLSHISQTAHFTFPPTWTLTMNTNGGGTTIPASGDYANGSTITIVAIPDETHVFERWAGSGLGSYTGPDNPATITLNGDIAEYAVFRLVTGVTVTTAPPGKRIGVDGADYTSPQTFAWNVGTSHVVDVDSLVAGTTGSRERFAQWSDSVLTPSRQIVTPASATTYTAEYGDDYFLDFQDPPDGVSQPGDGWHASGTAVTIQAVPDPGLTFLQWMGQGLGSYTGPDNPALVTMSAPITEAPSFGPIGYEFSISASDTDPYITTDAPAGGVRSLYFWMTCTDEGISAFEGDVTGDLPVYGFNTAPNVINYGDATHLYMAVGLCPGPGPTLLGEWAVNDTGGEVCLGPSASHGLLAAVDCTVFAVIDSVVVRGFSSSGTGPCFVPGKGCHGGIPRTSVAAAAQERAVEVTWERPEGTRTTGFHVYRSVAGGDHYERVTSSAVAAGARFVDRAVEGETSYRYQVAGVSPGGSESVLGEATVVTPEWAPLVTSFRGARPNPFGRETELSFTVASKSRVRISIYDVAGRLVRRLTEAELPPGDHVLAWDGRTRSGGWVPAGVYFARAEIGNYTATKKIVLLGGGR
jgi:hypothetical protein